VFISLSFSHHFLYSQGNSSKDILGNSEIESKKTHKKEKKSERKRGENK